MVVPDFCIQFAVPFDPARDVLWDSATALPLELLNRIQMQRIPQT
jgi:hypothetical protein